MEVQKVRVSLSGEVRVVTLLSAVVLVDDLGHDVTRVPVALLELPQRGVEPVHEPRRHVQVSVDTCSTRCRTPYLGYIV